MASIPSASRKLEFAQRALQIISAMIIIGIVAHGLAAPSDEEVLVHNPSGDYHAYESDPATWGFFLFFVAIWTIPEVIVLLVANGVSAHKRWLGYVCAGLESPFSRGLLDSSWYLSALQVIEVRGRRSGMGRLWRRRHLGGLGGRFICSRRM
ncbi:unnamed protein product [Zymoseptoria tritici ST99CH_1A5]|uniref:Uncharacterized protein n=4 Tax=Zymoseptoria tritici TaxID=1047171 RepID=F9X6R7_ZYMTI|nr:uncharacterized protein MYCGRDRAFT_91583 [Zymoseptoria tritici IPO323]SMQ48676.1 unnamed protein product [Zymoseptoria tritici ST99CH_3D7]SMR48492.1 unnamed protein product [Zymoseptoria tritici ST99CH_1E4]SMR49674.1 unnamed protein product [Zymoseptoria tritici ST99CH_3D1]SMY22371.1 unnamed protein product [Zymoseptoria tritici ST99CH_1A5]EGP88740.1 hypothetical protein MYCGRDRAFT_91583 [Zymoseptoria tritici IPO323]